MNSVLDNIYGNVIQTIAQARNKTPEQVKAIIDDGPFIGKKALSAGLIDALRYE